VYDIHKGNMNNEIKFYLGYNDETWKSHEDSSELRILYFISVLGLRTIKGGALGESLKFKSSKSIHKPKILEKPDLPGFLTGFLRARPDMSGPQPGHVRVPPYPRVSPA
jgi:hypothetical protein